MIPIQSSHEKHKILIADDSEMNRSILADMLGEEFEILEAENGAQAVELIQSIGWWAWGPPRCMKRSSKTI